MKLLRIGEVAKQAQVGVETVRFYERQGLLDQPQRRASGYRQYEVSAVARVHFIRRAKALGFTLSKVQEMQDLWFEQGISGCAVWRKAEAKIAELQERI